MDKMKVQSVILSSIFMLSASSILFASERVPDANSLFVIGSSKIIEVAVPKHGFICAPPTPAAEIPGIMGVPKWDKDFIKRFVRITVIEKNKLKEGVRIGLQLEWIDPNNTAIIFQDNHNSPAQPITIYYGYLDINDRCKMVGTTRPRDKNKDGSEREFIDYGALDRNSSYGLQFPLALTCPPLLSPERNIRNGGWIQGDNVLAFTESYQTQEGLRVRASLMEKVHPDRKKSKSYYYSDSDKTFTPENKPNTIEVSISSQETQIWKDPNDWLWETMERTDENGNIRMRCRQILVENVPQNGSVSQMPQSDIEFIKEASSRWHDLLFKARGGPPVDELIKVVNILREHELKKEDILVLLGEPDEKFSGEKGGTWRYNLADSKMLVVSFDNEGRCFRISGTGFGTNP